MQKWQYIHNQQLGDSRTRRRIVYQTRFIPRPEKCKSFILNATALKSFAAGSFIEVAPWISFTARGSISNMKTAFAAKIPPPSLGRGNFRLLLAPLLPVHFLNLLFHDANRLVEPAWVALIRSISTVANHLRAFCAGLPRGLRCPARTRNGR